MGVCVFVNNKSSICFIFLIFKTPFVNFKGVFIKKLIIDFLKYKL